MLKYLKLFDPTASSAALDPSALNYTAMTRYRRHPELIQALRKWTEEGDRSLYHMLRQLSLIVREVQPPCSETLQLYRGFNIGSFQEAMGIERAPSLGDSGNYSASSRMLSTSTSIEIASGFGEVVVAMPVKLSACECLPLTAELMTLVAKEQNRQPYTQYEVILLPPISVQYTVVKAP